MHSWRHSASYPRVLAVRGRSVESRTQQRNTSGKLYATRNSVIHWRNTFVRSSLFDPHFKQRKNYKLSCALHVIHTRFTSRNKNILVRAYVTCVRPLLEYSSIISSSHLKCDVDAIEKVQRRLTKRIPGFGIITVMSRD